MIEIKTFAKPRKSGNASGGGSSSVAYLQGIASEADHATRADRAKKAESAEQAAYADKAGNALNANYAATAGEVKEDAEVLRRYLRKDLVEDGHTEEVEGMVKFKENVSMEGDLAVSGSMETKGSVTSDGLFIGEEHVFGIDSKGNATVNSVGSDSFADPISGGFEIRAEKGVGYHLYIPSVTVWGRMELHTLEVAETKYAGGNLYLSCAGSKLVKVEPVAWDSESGTWAKTAEDDGEGWICYFVADDGEEAAKNPWREGDQVRCQTMDKVRSGGTYSDAANKTYWRTVVKNGVSQKNVLYADSITELPDDKQYAWVVIGKHTVALDGYTEDNAPTDTRGIPEAGDSIVLDGSRSDTSRQGVLRLESYGTDAPRIVGLRGICDYTHQDRATYSLSPEEVIVMAKRFRIITADNTETDLETLMGGISSEMASIKMNSSSLASTLTALRKDLSSASPTVLKNYTSNIRQTARDISLSVSEKAAGRRNLLPGSDFLGQDGGPFICIYGDFIGDTYTSGYIGAQGIHALGGIGGTNCLVAKSYFDGTNYQYSGMYWYGNGDSKNIRIERGKKYTVSCWVKCDSTEAAIYSENHSHESETSIERLGSYPTNGATWFQVKEANVWQLMSYTIDTANAKYDYLEINFFVLSQTKGLAATAWFCRPMMEEGDTYNGWTLSEQDCDRIGGNLLDNSASFSVGGNLTVMEANVIKKGYDGNVSVAYAPKELTASAVVEMAQWQFEDITANTDYVFSFMAEGEGDIVAYFYRADNDAAVFTEGCDGTVRDASGGHDGNVRFSLHNQWKRYWVHWRTKNISIPYRVLLRATVGSSVYVAEPKLERGVTMTEWTERKGDQVSRVELQEAGINIYASKVQLYGDKVEIVTTTGGTQQVAALFQDGKINASLIDADSIEVKHLWAKSDSGAKVGYFGNTEEEACKLSDDTLAPLFIGGSTAKTSPFYVTSKGAMHATSGYIGGFSIKDDGIVSDAGENSMYINTSFISFSNEEHGIENIVGANWNYGIDYTAQQIIVNYDHPTKMTYGNGQATGNQMNTGLYISVSGTKHQLSRDSWQTNSPLPCGNHAVLCEQGDFAGFRPCYRRITASQTLTKYDVFLEVVETWTKHNDVTNKDTTVDVGTVTISLPKDPEVGQMYWIVRSSKYNYTLKTTDGTLIYHPNGNGTSYTLTTANELACIIFNGSNWRLMWNMGV